MAAKTLRKPLPATPLTPALMGQPGQESADAFISHASQDLAVATRLADGLKARGFRVWLDHEVIKLGVLLGKELLTAIRGSRVLILLWSESAAASRWVNTEWLAAFQLDRFILPCVLDETPLPQCIGNAVHEDLRKLRSTRAHAAVLDHLCRALKEAPNAANPVAPLMRHESARLKQAIGELAAGQRGVTDAIAVDLALARKRQDELDGSVASALREWPLDPVILNLGAYHLKNAYMLKHWNAIQAGSAPPDALLRQAENAFIRTLSVDPTDMSALNGFGNIFFFGRDLDAAAFFHDQALSRAQKKGKCYPAAKHDRAMVQRFQDLAGQNGA